MIDYLVIKELSQPGSGAIVKTISFLDYVPRPPHLIITSLCHGRVMMAKKRKTLLYIMMDQNAEIIIMI